MTIMLITYQPAGRPSDRLPHLISTMGEFWSPVANVWLLKTSLSASTLLSRLRTSISASDNLLVMELGKRYATNLPEGGKEWLYANIRENGPKRILRDIISELRHSSLGFDSPR